MKKVFAILLALTAVSVVMTGCGGGEKADDTTKAAPADPKPEGEEVRLMTTGVRGFGLGPPFQFSGTPTPALPRPTFPMKSFALAGGTRCIHPARSGLECGSAAFTPAESTVACEREGAESTSRPRHRAAGHA